FQITLQKSLARAVFLLSTDDTVLCSAKNWLFLAASSMLNQLLMSPFSIQYNRFEISRMKRIAFAGTSIRLKVFSECPKPWIFNGMLSFVFATYCLSYFVYLLCRPHLPAASST
ncbi:hypothetical protein, partial [Arcticibacter sp.]|uniref:hypothetical protein n=1 Tax=Arcticibacter sp. TaxID=1872630 RepID=UPI00388E3525